MNIYERNRISFHHSLSQKADAGLSLFYSWFNYEKTLIIITIYLYKVLGF